ncbi:MAG TPA: CNNM domain-containing protein, partial [Gemmatimonadales bacterium]|nr:CNNM domain-containing protein [Gemmatimonadales bacterium]
METSSSGSILTGLGGVVLLVALNAFFVAAEFSLVASRKTRLEEMIERGDRRAELAHRVKTSLNRYISATQLGITLTSLGLGWVGEPALAGLISGAMTWLPGRLQVIATHAVAATIAFTLISMLHIVLGELVPKAFALLHPEDVARFTVAPLMGFN